ncbi:MAG: ribosome silencing factor [Dysgonamonadaceae bacterium]|jgi:ribosome-associated protein|nr:ribosome silencing factor [Dysgonamonadaceae bacterium]
MSETEILVNTIIEALQEKKGKRIITMDLSVLEGAICQYFIICQGNTPTQVSALSDSVWDVVYEQLHEKPLGAVGMREAQWVAMDYGSVILHIFIPELRAYYNLENLWADADTTEIPDIL